MYLHSTYRKMIPARNATDAHAYGFVANYELLLPSLKVSAQCTGPLLASRNILTFSLCRRTLCRCHQEQFSMPPPPLSTLPRTSNTSITLPHGGKFLYLNVMAGWLECLLHMREVLGWNFGKIPVCDSNLGQGYDTPDWCSS